MERNLESAVALAQAVRDAQSALDRAVKHAAAVERAGAPEFSEQRLADAWIRDNHKPGESYTTARIGPTVRAVTTLEEVTG